MFMVADQLGYLSMSGYMWLNVVDSGFRNVCCIHLTVDGCNFTKRQQSSPGEVNEGRSSQESSRSLNVNSPSNQESNTAVYSVPAEYEDLSHLDSNPKGDYHELNPMTLGVPQGHVYSSLDTRPNNIGVRW